MANIVVTNDTIREVVAKEIEHLGLQANLNHIDVSLVTDMSSLFEKSPFNGDISGWNVSKLKYIYDMFEGSPFNQDISRWDTSSVEYPPEYEIGETYV